MLLRFVMDKFAGGAKVYQNGAVVGRDNDIVGLNVAMQDVALMDIIDGFRKLCNIIDSGFLM